MPTRGWGWTDEGTSLQTRFSGFVLGDRAPACGTCSVRRRVTARNSATGIGWVSLGLDDPSFKAPIYANLVADAENEDGYNLIWSRPTSKNGD